MRNHRLWVHPYKYIWVHPYLAFRCLSRYTACAALHDGTEEPLQLRPSVGSRDPHLLFLSRRASPPTPVEPRRCRHGSPPMSTPRSSMPETTLVLHEASRLRTTTTSSSSCAKRSSSLTPSGAASPSSRPPHSRGLPQAMHRSPAGGPLLPLPPPPPRPPRARAPALAAGRARARTRPSPTRCRSPPTRAPTPTARTTASTAAVAAAAAGGASFGRVRLRRRGRRRRRGPLRRGDARARRLRHHRPLRRLAPRLPVRRG